MQRSIFLAATSVAALFATSHIAMADCSFTIPGSTVTCDATDLDGFDDNTDNLSVTVVPGATVNGVDGIVVEGDNTSITNDGDIVTSDEGVVGGEGFTVVNNGLIDAGDKAIDADNHDNVTVFNTGDIRAVDKGIRIGNGDNANVEITSSGSLRSGDEGIEAGDMATIVVSGEVISSGDDAIQIGENGSITNSGIIRSSGDDGIDIDSGTILNNSSGAILSTVDAAIDFDGSSIASMITNNGVISGTIGILSDPANVAAQVVTNTGFLEGTDGVAFDLGAGSDSYTHGASAVLVGATDFGSGDDSFMFDSVLSGVFADGEVMDGGDNFDTMSFAAYTLADVSDVVMVGDYFSLFFGADSVNLRSWERLSLSGAEVDFDTLVSEVPLPAGIWGLIGALGLLAWVRRRA